MADKLPQRPRSHEIEDVARGSFLTKKPPQWACNESKNDYGWDFLVTVQSSPEQLGDDFFVQLKGSESVNYLSGSQELSHPIEVRTVNWLISKPIPTMFAVCDVAADDKPIYWIWLSEAVEKLDQSNPSWKTQDTVSIRIPLANRFSTECFPSIEQDVRDWHEQQRFAGELIRAVSSNPPAAAPLEGRRSDNIYQLKREVLSSLHKVGLVDVSETEAGIKAEVYGPADQETRKKIQEASTLLDAFQDVAARRILDAVEAKIGEASVGIKATYINCRGVLALHDGKDGEALQAFREALVLRPEETKYAVNVLTVEYKIAADGETDLPSDWDDRLAAVLSEDPDSAGATRLKATRLATLEGLHEAEKYLESSNLWRDQKQDALITLAEILRDHGEIDHALELVSDAEAIPEGKDNPFLFSLKGNLLLHKAVGSKKNDKGLIIRGLGPADLDARKLRLSAEAYQRACTLFGQRGYPLIAERTFLNATTVMVLLGDYAAAERLAGSFLEFHPGNGPLHGALAMALSHRGDPVPAIPHARQALDEEPEFSQNYINLLIIMAQAEDYDALLELARERQKQGFRSRDEECPTRVLVAVAYAEKGEFELANSQVEFLLNERDFYADGVVAEAAVAKRRGEDNKNVAAQIRERLNKVPNDPCILTFLVQYLLPPTEETAEGIINSLKQVAEVRQLGPDEMLALGRAHLIKESLDDAEVVFRSGRLRYPTDARFLVELAHALSRKGDDEGGYETMA